MQDNSEQRAAWNGNAGASWQRYQDALDDMMQPITARLLGAVAAKPGEHILDIGCGCGQTTIALARAVAPGGDAAGIDISALLLESARERSARLGLPLSFIEADAATHDFAARYDKLVSRFGVMFFADPVAAFAHLKGALAPAGRMIFVCWRKFEENPWMAAILGEAAKIVTVPPRPTHYVPGPFAFGDKDFLASVLARAGFAKTEIEGFDPLLKMPGATLEERIEFYARIGPMAGLLREASDEGRRALMSMLKSFVERRIAAGEDVQKSACWLVCAR